MFLRGLRKAIPSVSERRFHGVKQTCKISSQQEHGPVNDLRHLSVAIRHELDVPRSQRKSSACTITCKDEEKHHHVLLTFRACLYLENVIRVTEVDWRSGEQRGQLHSTEWCRNDRRLVKHAHFQNAWRFWKHIDNRTGKQVEQLY